MRSVSETPISPSGFPKTGKPPHHLECSAITVKTLWLAPWGVGFISIIPTFVFSSHFSHNTLFALILTALFLAFFLSGSWRFTALMQKENPEQTVHMSRRNLPKYTVIVALYDEAQMVPQLLKALNAINYPRQKLEIILAVENHDAVTNLVISTAKMPQHFHHVIVTEGHPQTKPRALNAALTRATGRYVVVYDAEDIPHPEQLRAAASRFRQDPDLVCLQAALIPKGHSWLARQFCAEYAALFQVLTPAASTLGLPFALGGTSNHLCCKTLHQLGGWDSWNVTEDADLGLRLGRYGGKTAMLYGYPTYETAPEQLAQWLPQRARWLKGFIQTLAVHLHPIGWRKTVAAYPDYRFWLAMVISLLLPLLSAALYAPASLLIIVRCLEGLIHHRPPTVPSEAWALVIWGWMSGVCCIVVGLKRAGASAPSLKDLLSLPLYWSLKSLAFVLACWQLMFRPYHWNKTAHYPFVDPLALPFERPVTADFKPSRPRKQTGRGRKAAVSG